MANQVTYRDVEISSRERACLTSPTSNPGDIVTYAELRVHRKSERTSKSETSPSGPGSQYSVWFYVALVLGLIALALLAIIITVFWRGNSKSPSELRTTCTETATSSEETACTGRCSATMNGLMEDLCEDKEGGTQCWLCPSQWMLHKERCYYFSEQEGTWDAGMQNCSGRKSQLIVVEDKIDREFIETRTENKYFWIGLKFQEEGRWMWLDDSQLEGHKLRQWMMGNGSRDVKNCAAVKKEKLYPETCTTLFRWICKKNASLLAPWNTATH